MALKVPFVCLCEQAKTYMRVLDRSYFTVEYGEAGIGGSRVQCLEEGVSHVDAPLATSKEQILVKELLKLTHR